MPDLSGNTALDVAIGLSFVFLLFSVLCSAIQEAIAAILDLRAANLEDGLRNLLDDPGEGTGGAPSLIPSMSMPRAGSPPQPGVGRCPRVLSLTDELLGHGLIRTQYRGSTLLFRRKRRGPSYISSRSFALALLDLVATNRDGTPAPNLTTAIATANIPLGSKHALMSLARTANGNRDKFREQVEQWFDGAMDRVSGWYTRRTQVIVCMLALLVAVGLNVNTIAIADRLAHDGAVRAAVVAQAVKADVNPTDALDPTAKRITDVQELGLPIGWSKKDGDPVKADLGDHFVRTAGGWLLTFLALSLGAPFWFGALNRLCRLRSTGPAPKAVAKP